MTADWKRRRNATCKTSADIRTVPHALIRVHSAENPRFAPPLFWCHADRAVQPDGLAVEHVVLDDVLHQGRVLLWLAEPFGEWDLLAQRLPRRLGQRTQQRRIKNPR